ncbi:MAG TPA: 2-hydroxyacid dehydrogenase [Streptosporangiaceae bacterium]
MLIWVPLQAVVSALDGLDGVEIEVVDPDDGTDLPASAAKVEFYVPPLFPRAPAVAALDAMPGLKVVQTLTAGIDVLRPHVPAGAVLCNARGVHDASTAEWVVAAILAALRQFPYFAAEQAAGRWSNRFTGSLAGRTVLIVGYGSIGAAVDQRLAGFDATIVRVARSAREGVHPIADLPGLLPQADVVVMLAPVTAATIGMVDAGFLAAMKDGALLVNVARGTLVVTDDLCAELRTGRLHAALDVTDPEPLPAGHPLWSMPNALITPHIAATTAVSALAVLGFLRAQVERYLTGTPLVNVITGEY